MKHALQNYIFASCCFAAIGFLPVASAAEKPMNVLFLAVDDMNDWISPLGGRPDPITPNLAKLAASSVCFTNAHTASPACHPSRVAIMTGVRPSTTGINENVFNKEVGPSWRKHKLLKDVVTLSQHFRNHGYHAAGAGKIFHSLQWWPGSENDPDTWDEYWPEAHKPIPFQVRPPEDRVKVLQNDNMGRRPLSNALFGWEPLQVKDSEMSDYQVASWATEQLNKEHEKPFFLAVGIFRPHIPWEVPQEYYDMYPLDKMKMPTIEEDDLADTHSHNRRNWHQWVVANKQWELAVQSYLASITFADRQIGRVLDALENSQYRDNTIVVLWSDHGMHIGEKENWEKFTLWEESTRIPMFIRVPGLTKNGTTVSRPVCTVDVYPTLVELTGTTAPAHLEGESLVPLLKNKDAERKTPAISSNSKGDAIRTDHWRYILYNNGFEELYDHQNDSDEFTNLAYDPAYRSTLDEHRALVEKHIGKKPPEGYGVPAGFLIDKNHRVRKDNYVSITEMVASLLENHKNRANRDLMTFNKKESLPGNLSPLIGGRMIKIEAAIIGSPDAAGVIVAQGGDVLGYSLVVQDGSPELVIRVNTKVHTLKSNVKLKKGKSLISIRIWENGYARLQVNDEPIAEGQFPSIQKHPNDGISIGRDDNSLVGNYDSPFPYNKRIQSVLVATGKKAE